MKAVLVAIALPGLMTLVGCSTEKAAAPKPCCDQPKIPAGVTPFRVVGEETSGPSDGQRVVLQVALEKPIKRDAVYPVLHTLYRHAMKRTAFEPIHFVASVYDNEAHARVGGDQNLVARILREQSDIAPKCDNQVRYDFAEQVERAFAASTGRAVEENANDTCHLAERKAAERFDDGFAHKASYKVDVERRAIEVIHPYLDMGKDEYVKELRLNSALGDWAEYMTSLFRKVEDLKEITFTGLHHDQPAVKIAVTRNQFESILAGLQENIAAHSAHTFASLGMHKTDDKGALKEQETFKSKTYKTALAELPKSQVSISAKLK